MITINKLMRFVDSKTNEPCGAIVLQGCTRRCKNCPVKDRTALVAGEHIKIVDVAKRFKQTRLQTVLIMGAEPLMQTNDVSELIKQLHLMVPTVVVKLFTTYSVSDLIELIETSSNTQRLIEQVDVLYVPDEQQSDIAFHDPNIRLVEYRIAISEHGRITFENTGVYRTGAF